VLAPYARGREVTRAATSQRERDDDAKRTVLAADKFLRGVRALIADPKMHPDSAAVLRWYEEEITEASRKRDGRRLAELRDEFADDAAGGEFRRVRWWQGTPAALAAAVDPGDGDDAEDYEDDPEEWAGDGEGQGDEAAAVLAASASIAAAQHAMTWAEGLAVCGWRLGEVIGGGHGEICQVIDEHGQRCRMAGMHLVPIGPLGRHVPLCPGHHDPLGGLIIETNRARGVA
jgi:hypothetical protein